MFQVGDPELLPMCMHFLPPLPVHTAESKRCGGVAPKQEATYSENTSRCHYVTSVNKCIRYGHQQQCHSSRRFVWARGVVKVALERTNLQDYVICGKQWKQEWLRTLIVYD